MKIKEIDLPDNWWVGKGVFIITNFGIDNTSDDLWVAYPDKEIAMKHASQLENDGWENLHVIGPMPFRRK